MPAGRYDLRDLDHVVAARQAGTIMADTTITGSIATGIILTARTTTITATGTVAGTQESAVFGSFGTPWTISNAGSIVGSGGFDGILLIGSGVVTNAESAQIAGYAALQAIAGAGTVVNATRLSPRLSSGTPTTTTSGPSLAWAG